MRNRPELAKAIDALPTKGVLVLAEWERATRSLMDGIHIMEKVHKRDAYIKVLDRPGLDLTTPSGRGILALLSVSQRKSAPASSGVPTNAASPPSSEAPSSAANPSVAHNLPGALGLTMGPIGGQCRYRSRSSGWKPSLAWAMMPVRRAQSGACINALDL